jgi:SHS2 domain-containing protein
MASWDVLDHTADLAIAARGADAAEALDALCAGLLAQVTAPEAVEPREAVTIVVDGLDAAEALVAALGELLYWLNVRGWVFRRVETIAVSETRISLRAWGEPREPARHPFEREIKAATYHELSFGPDPAGPDWVARVVFDV